jgi:hypothetical protein
VLPAQVEPRICSKAPGVDGNLQQTEAATNLQSVWSSWPHAPQKVCPKHPSKTGSGLQGGRSTGSAEGGDSEEEIEASLDMEGDESEGASEERGRSNGEAFSLASLDLAKPIVDWEDLPLSAALNPVSGQVLHHGWQRNLEVGRGPNGEECVVQVEADSSHERSILTEGPSSAMSAAYSPVAYLGLERAFVLKPADMTHPSSMEVGGRIRLRAVELAGEGNLVSASDLERDSEVRLEGGVGLQLESDDKDVPIGSRAGRRLQDILLWNRIKRKPKCKQ